MTEFESAIMDLKNKYPDVDIDKLVEAARLAKDQRIPPYKTLGVSVDYLESCYGYGYRALHAGKYNEALGVFLLLNSLDPFDTRFILGAALSYEKMKRYLDAIRLYFDLYQADPEDPFPFFSIYEAFLIIGEKEPAFAALSAFIILSEKKKTDSRLRERAIQAFVPLSIEIQEMKVQEMKQRQEVKS